jgi:NAD(P)H dehydrogenase (quinone)
MTIAIIGATGQLGRHTIDALLERGVDASDIVALGRDSGRLQQLSERGLRTATIDLADEDATGAALSGIDSLLLISVGAPGEGLALRTAAINAAAAAGVPRLVYTSALNAPTTTLKLAAEHKATEDVITASGIPATFLRNGWYTENLQQDFETARANGVIANSVGDGRLATATRRDFAEAAAVVLTTPGHDQAAYELSGDTAWTYADFADAAQQVLGTAVRYEALTPEQERDMLLAAGLEEGTVGFMGLLHADMRDDTLAATPGDLSRLIGRPTTPLIDTLESWR